MERRNLIRISSAITVTETSQVAEARRKAASCSEELRIGETIAGRAAIVATELATNLVKHGNGGSLLFGCDEEVSRSIAMAAIDKGQGIASLGDALRDGFSTAGSLGTGLGAIRRSADAFDVYSTHGKGTAVFCSVSERDSQPGPQTALPARLSVAGISIPKPGQDDNGDAWTTLKSNDVFTVVVIDGLGHGGAAAIASAAGIRAAKEKPDAAVEEMMQNIHGALRSTRGAAVAIARIHAANGRVDYCGIGNIAGAIVTDDGTRRLVSHNGIAGHEMRKVQVFSYPWTASSVLIMHSDGLGATWSGSAYAGLFSRDAALIASVLYRDLCRGTDDATIVAVKAS